MRVDKILVPLQLVALNLTLPQLRISDIEKKTTNVLQSKCPVNKNVFVFFSLKVLFLHFAILSKIQNDGRGWGVGI